MNEEIYQMILDDAKNEKDPVLKEITLAILANMMVSDSVKEIRGKGQL